MDPVLLPFLRSKDEAEREQLLSQILLLEAAPLVRRVLQRRLGFYVNYLGANPQNQEAEDLYHDVMVKLIDLLNDPKLRTGRVEVKDLRQYVMRLASNACHDHLRAKARLGGGPSPHQEANRTPIQATGRPPWPGACAGRRCNLPHTPAAKRPGGAGRLASLAKGPRPWPPSEGVAVAAGDRLFDVLGASA